MAEILRILSVGGDLGIWILLFATWRFHERLMRLEFNHKNHGDMDQAEFNRVNHRLEALERN